MISISDLTEPHSKKKRMMDKIFGEVLVLCHRRIKYAANNSKSSCFYDVPTCVIGLPVYDLKECIKYIMNKLKRNNLDVSLRQPRTLFISWEKHQEDYVKPVKMTDYKQPVYVPVSNVQQPQLYANEFSSNNTGPRYFMEENILQLMPPPKLHYVKPKYPDTLAVSSRPVQTRLPYKPQRVRQTNSSPNDIQPPKPVKPTKATKPSKTKYKFKFT